MIPSSLLSYIFFPFVFFCFLLGFTFVFFRSQAIFSELFSFTCLEQFSFASRCWNRFEPSSFHNFVFVCCCLFEQFVFDCCCPFRFEQFSFVQSFSFTCLFVVVFVVLQTIVYCLRNVLFMLE